MASFSTVTLGSRGSRLALRQTEEVVERLRRANPAVAFSVVTFTTSAERHPDLPLPALGQGAFVKELETALLERRVDAVAHSLKDLPTEPTPGLAIGAVAERGDPRDALVNRWRCTVAALPPGARIGTSSPRRAALLRAARPDLQVLPIRGKVDTRLRKARGDDYDGVVVAAAGLHRLGLEHEISEYLSPREWPPAPGQGALAVQVRDDDGPTASLVAPVDHLDTRRAVEAERVFLRALGGGCRVPAGAYASIHGNGLEITGMVALESGDRMYRASVSGRSHDPEGAGQELYQRLLELGAGALLGVRA